MTNSTAIAYGLVYVPDQSGTQSSALYPPPGHMGISDIECVQQGLFDITFADNFFANFPTVIACQVYNGQDGGTNVTITKDENYGGENTLDNAKVIFIAQSGSGSSYKCRIATGDGSGDANSRNFAIIAVGVAGSGWSASNAATLAFGLVDVYAPDSESEVNARRMGLPVRSPSGISNTATEATGIYQVDFEDIFANFPAVVACQVYNADGNGNATDVTVDTGYAGGDSTDNATVNFVAKSDQDGHYYCHVMTGDGKGNHAKRCFALIAAGAPMSTPTQPSVAYALVESPDGEMATGSTLSIVAQSNVTDVEVTSEGLYTVHFAVDQFSDFPAVVATQVFNGWSNYPETTPITSTNSTGPGDSRDNAKIVYVAASEIDGHYYARVMTGDGDGNGSKRSFAIVALGNDPNAPS